MSIIIKNCLHDNKQKDIYIENNIISEISNNINVEAEHKIDGKNKAIIPSFMNSHSHAAMTLFRGYGDDLKLMDWLQNRIWPNEAKMTEKIVYQGSKLACLEMIKSGTTMFNDMYWHFKGTAKAVEETGMRAALNAVFIDLADKNKANEQININKKLYEEYKNHKQIQFSLGPHSIYTVSKESLIWAKEFAEKHNLKLHIHVSENEAEVKDCIKEHGMRPIEYLNEIGFLSSNVIAAHTVWVNKKEVDILAKNNVSIAYNPVSNMKLAVNNVFPYKLFKQNKVNICLGTDSAASNNNLSMFDTMKFASLIQKHHYNDPTVLRANECFKMATRNGFKFFGLNAGEIKEGMLADFNLIKLKMPEMIPNHNLISNVVYAANGSCVNTTVCNGKILMNDRVVKNEEEIVNEAIQTAKEFLN